ncbi:MAG: RNase adapter RapZ [Acidobacteriota bacterium]
MNAPDPAAPDASDARNAPRLVVITGLSGSGKSVAGNALEDLDYFRVDNLPISLLRTFLADPSAHVGAETRVAIVADARAPGFEEAMPELLAELDRPGRDRVLLFLEARDEVLQRRYSETRRRHPLGRGERPVIDGIRRERELLRPLHDAADLIFDSSDWSVHDMRKAVHRQFGDDPEGFGPLVVSLVSFGFKHGQPVGSDLVFDVRFLTNPHFVPGLRELTGRDAAVQNFLAAESDIGELIDRLEDLLLFLLPRYRQENRRYLTVAIGCTGGKHRSVAAAEHLSERLGAAGWPVRLSHRDSTR